MAVQIMEVRDKFRKFTISFISGCFRSVRHHPFIVGMLVFLTYLYRSSPMMFSLLVSSSPVLICTALLLGILLSYGESNIPEIEEKTARDSVLVKKIEEVPSDSSLVEKDESFNVERYGDELGFSNDHHQLNPSANKIDEVRDEDDSADDTTPLIGERSRRIESEGDEVCEGKRRVDDSRNKQKIELIEEETSEHHHYAPIPDIDDEHLHLNDDGDGKSDTDSFDSQKVNVDSLDSPPHSPWSRIKEMEEKEGTNEEDDDASDSESGGSESSSPDASMAEIRPMLDVLHPLMARGDVSLQDDGLEHSLESNLDSQESDDNVLENKEDDDDEHENREEEKEGINKEVDVLDSESDGSESSSPDASMAEIRPMLDELHPLLNAEPSGALEGSEHSLESSSDSQESEDDGLENEEDGVRNDGEDETKNAITWTEEDQKNLMDLGSSEIERNLRLEHLIMRRRSRRNMASEKNLIDFEGFDLPFSIPSITTRRQNPFDVREGSNDSELPPIPGSAPSILLPRRNPFDLPYDSSEEKPDLKGDGFEEEFKTVQPMESLFRRYESFKVGPSSLAPTRMKPYFVPERTFSEESNYSLFQRQSSGVSESKVSSVPETDSIASVDDLDVDEQKRKISEEDDDDDVQGPEAAITTVDEEDSSRSDTDDPIDENPVITHFEPVEDEASTHEPELILKIEDDYDIGHGSESSEEVDSHELGQVDVHVLERETQFGDTSDPYRSVEFESASPENVMQRQSRGSSSSSLSEVSERIYTEPEIEPEGFFALEEEQHVDDDQERDISAQNSVESAPMSISRTTVPDILQREPPFYDLSPREVRTNLAAAASSSSSVSSDVHQGSDLPFEVTEGSVPSTEREIEGDVVDMPKIVEEADALVEFNQELLSELDFVGDFSNSEISNEVSVVDWPKEIDNHGNISEIEEQADGSMDKDESTASVSEAIVGDDDDSHTVQSQIGSDVELREVEGSMMLEDNMRSNTEDGSVEVQENIVPCSSVEVLTSDIKNLSTTAVEDSTTAKEPLSESDHETEGIHSEPDISTGKNQQIETITDTISYPSSVAVEELSMKDVAGS